MSINSLFETTFDSYCRSCGDDIYEGDSAGFVEGFYGIQCEGCFEAATDNYYAD